MIPPIILPPGWKPDPDKAWLLLKIFGPICLINSALTALGFWLLPMTESRPFLNMVVGWLTLIIASAAMVCLIPITLSLLFAPIGSFIRRQNKKNDG